MGELSNLSNIQQEEEKRQGEKIQEDKYKSALQEKINQRSFLADLISNTDAEFVERKITV